MTFDQALVTLQKRKVISSPAYWTQNATAGRKCGGEHVGAVIRNFVRAAIPNH